MNTKIKKIIKNKSIKKLHTFTMRNTAYISHKYVLLNPHPHITQLAHKFKYQKFKNSSKKLAYIILKQSL